MTWSVCQRASGDERVAARSFTTSDRTTGATPALPDPEGCSGVDVEQVAQRLDEAVALGRAGGLAEGDGGLVQQLGDKALAELLDGGHLGVVEAGEAAAALVARKRVGWGKRGSSRVYHGGARCL